MKESQLHEGRARIKVVGCGGGGGNAVNRMISKAIKVEFIAVNTDKQALERCQADVKVQMGNKVTRGLGAGGDWTRGRDAADESRTELSAVVQDSDMVFITCGMGGGTGTGSAAIVAELSVIEPLPEVQTPSRAGTLYPCRFWSAGRRYFRNGTVIVPELTVTGVCVGADATAGNCAPGTEFAVVWVPSGYHYPWVYGTASKFTTAWGATAPN